MKTYLLGLMLFFLAIAVPADETREAEAKLENLRKQIKALNAEIQRTTAARDDERQALSQVEKEIITIRTRLGELDEAQAQTNTELEKLKTKLMDKRHEVGHSTNQLVTQLRAAYIHGQPGAVKVLLNSQDPIGLAREATYFGYITRYRQTQLEKIRQQLETLRVLDEQFKAKLAEQEALEDEARQGLKSLEQAVVRRREALAVFDQTLRSKAQEADRLADQEAALTRLLEELKDLLADYPVQTDQAFAGLKGQLQWPIPGRLAHDFGQPRAEKIDWQGLVILAKPGTRVRAIARGRVSYADWLPGMGLLVIVDHGGGYMSLYGYNQAVTRAIGDWVAPGDTLALVGDTGGQSQPSLYFEIRASGKPSNPHPWFKTTLPTPKP